MAEIARRLVEALKDAGYERTDATKKNVAILHTELCAEARVEAAESAK